MRELKWDACTVDGQTDRQTDGQLFSFISLSAENGIFLVIGLAGFLLSFPRVGKSVGKETLVSDWACSLLLQWNSALAKCCREGCQIAPVFVSSKVLLVVDVTLHCNADIGNVMASLLSSFPSSSPKDSHNPVLKTYLLDKILLKVK